MARLPQFHNRAVQRDPRVMSGNACLRGTRIPVSMVLDNLAEDSAALLRCSESYCGWPDPKKIRFLLRELARWYRRGKGVRRG